MNPSNDNSGLLPRNAGPDEQRAALLTRYQLARDAQVNAARDLASATKDRLMALLGRVDGSITRSGSAVTAVRGIDQGVSTLNTAQRIEHATQALEVQRQGIDAALAGIDAEIAGVLTDVARGVAPERPANATDAAIADRKADLVALLSASAGGANATAQSVLRRAIADNDLLTIYVLTGEPMRFALQAIPGVEQSTLQSVYASAVAERDPNALQAHDVNMIGSRVPGGAFLALQRTGPRLADVVDLGQQVIAGNLALAMATFDASVTRYNDDLTRRQEMQANAYGRYQQPGPSNR
jgi:hypothetical protein